MATSNWLWFCFLSRADSRVFLAVSLHGFPNIHCFLHPDQETGAHLEQTSQPVRHVDAEIALLRQHLVDGSSGHSDRIGKLALAQAKLRQQFLAYQLPGVRRPPSSPVQD